MPIYSYHAKRRLEERGISEEEVEFVLEHPYMETPGDRPDRVCLWGKPKGRKVKVVVYKNQRDFILSVVAPEEMD